MRKKSRHPSPPTPRVVIIGAGFAGAYAARHLQKLAGDSLEIEVINQNNYFVFQPLLAEVAAGTINVQDAVTPLRLMLKGIKVRLAEVLDVDFQNKCIHLVQGRRRVLGTAKYDHLVIATGQQPDLSRFPGFLEHSLTMKNLADAYTLRNHVIACLEAADVAWESEVKHTALTFVVAGGGFSGVETAGEMHEMIARALRFYPNISREEVRIIIIQRGARLLEELPESLGEYTRKKFRQRGIQVMVKTGLAAARAEAVELDSGEVIDTRTLVTTVGNGPSPFVQSLGIELERGKIRVDEYLRVKGRENLWSLGDIALVPNGQEEGSFAPPTAQFAVREARLLAKNLFATVRKKKLHSFSYKPRGALASLGNYQGVAQVFGLRLSGFIGWCLWRFIYMGMLPGHVSRLRIALNWLLDYFIPRNIVQVEQPHGTGTRYRRLAAGEQAYRKGDLLDGFYVVVSGRLELRVPEQGGKSEHRVQFGPGEHFGERIIENNVQMTGNVTALEESRVLVLDRRDFQRLREALPTLEQYFASIDQSKYSTGMRNQTNEAFPPGD